MSQEELEKAKEECSETCGDGVNFGGFECDDANFENGDGCSSECRVESGIVCRRKDVMSPDVCGFEEPLLRYAGVDNGKYIANLFLGQKVSLAILQNLQF